MKAVRHETTAIVTKDTAIAVATILDANANFGSNQAELSASQISHAFDARCVLRSQRNTREIAFARISK